LGDAALPAFILLTLALGLAHALPVVDPAVVAAFAIRLGFGPAQDASSPVAAGAALAILLFSAPALYSGFAAAAQRLRGKEPAPGSVALTPLLLAGLPLLAAGVALRLDLLPPVPGWRWLPGGVVIAGALVLFVTDRVGLTIRRLEHVGVISGFVTGAAWLVSLLPAAHGLSWALGTARLLDLERPDALRLAAIAAVPALIVHAAWLGLAGWTVLWWLAAATSAALGSLLVLLMLSAWLRRRDLWPLALLELLAGVALLLG
jgi:undecaprenyl-diphosphatase